MTIIRCLMLLVAVMLAGCSTSAVDLAYQPGTTAAARAPQTKPIVGVGPFADERGEAANYLGSVRGGFGNPLKTLTSTEPVSEVVRKAFADGLAARGLLAANGSGRYQLTGSVQALDCTQYVRREATARVLVTVVDTGSGRTVLSRTFEDMIVSGSFTMATGVFGSVTELQQVAAQALRQTVDKALDSAEMRAALE